MAKFDDDLIEKVGIYFETHDESAAEVAKLHNIPRSTMYSWVSARGWIQNKYQGVRRSAGGLIDDATIKAVKSGAMDAVIGEVMEADSYTGHSDIDRAGKVAGEVIRDVLTRNELQEEASIALRRAIKIAGVSPRINDQRTVIECIKTVQEIIFGKNPDMVFLGDFSKITDVDVANMSQEELLQLAKGIHNNNQKGEE